ncbi:MAG: S1 family peptidase [Ruminococcus sp.]|uniref:hypothetical protein n=1 Tax=Ruminococcus sp. TaxID=41978 RepID=UPI0025D49AA0|nr:hypothetical protein [Ruminococcus sp.]MCR5601188.1 S1 family peptidase [Ruminococcus sp.]
MKKSITTIASMIYALTLVAPMAASAENTESGGDLLKAAYTASAPEFDAEEMEQQLESNSVYTELTEAYADDEDSLSFEYAGGYINEDNNLVVCAADAESSVEEIVNEIDSICSTDITNVVVEKVKYSYEELEQAREEFDAALAEQIAQAEANGDTDLYDFLSTITSNSIDEELNKLIVYVPDLDDDKLAILDELFDCDDIVSFENDEDPDAEIEATVRPGRAIYGIKSRSGGKITYSRFSIGYRARYKKNGTMYYGFCTAGHGTQGLESGKYIYSETTFKNSDRIGECMKDMRSGNVDAAFVKLYSGNTFSNSYGSYSFVGYKYMTNVAKNSTIYKVGSTTGFSQGTVESSDCSVTVSGVKHTHQVKCKIKAAAGDSGGLFFAYYNPDGKGGYLAAGVLVGGGKTYHYYTKCPYVLSDMGVEPY